MKKDRLYRLCFLVRPLPGAVAYGEYDRALLSLYLFAETVPQTTSKALRIIESLPFKLIVTDCRITSGNFTIPEGSLLNEQHAHVEQKWVDEAFEKGLSVALCWLRDDWSADEFFSTAAA